MNPYEHKKTGVYRQVFRDPECDQDCPACAYDKGRKDEREERDLLVNARLAADLAIDLIEGRDESRQSDKE
jgi:hypothetical protein